MLKKYLIILLILLSLISCDALKIQTDNTYEFNGTIYIHDDSDKLLENGTAIINPNSINKQTITDENTFLINLKSNQENAIVIKVKNMSKYYDIIDTFYISSNIKQKEFILKPAAKSHDLYKDKLMAVDTLIKKTERKLDEIEKIANNSIDPNLKRDLNRDVLEKREQIKNLKQQLIEKKSELETFENLILSGTQNVTDISRLEKFWNGIDLIENNTKDVYVSISRYRNIIKSQEDNRYNDELKGETFWKPGTHSIDDVFKNITSKQKILKLIADINELYDSFYMYFDNTKTIYLTIECSADKDTYNTLLDISDAKKYLKNNNVNIEDKDTTSDIKNYNLAYLRGYSLMRYVIENQKCKSCNTKYTLIVYGSSLAPITKNETIKEEHRFAKYTYRLIPQERK